MHQADVDRWREIDNGVRRPTWADFIGDPDAAEYLSGRGRALARRMAGDLDRFFGPDWLAAAIGAGIDAVPKLPTLGKVSPVLASIRVELPDIESFIVGNFIELVRWWASIRVMSDDRGIHKVRAQLRSNLELPNFLHSMTELRLAAIARSLGAEVHLERQHGTNPPRPQDVEVSVDRRTFLIEVTPVHQITTSAACSVPSPRQRRTS